MREPRNSSARWLGLALGLCLGFVASLATPADASRNAGGSYALPAGNPVVTGSAISSTWANNTLTDIGTEITNSLDRSGRGGMTGTLSLATGSSGALSANWTAETTTGFYRAASNDIRFQVAGTVREKWTATTNTINADTTINGVTTNGTAATATALVSGSGTGVLATGGSWGGVGIIAYGGAGDGGAASGGSGAQFVAGTNAAYALVVQGATTTVAGTSATVALATNNESAGSREQAMRLAGGHIKFSAATAPTSTVAFKNALDPANIVKAWGHYTLAAGNPTLGDAFSVTSVTCAANTLTVTMAQAMASSNYAIIANVTSGLVNSTISSSTVFTVSALDNAGAAINLCTAVGRFDFLVIGNQ